MKRVHFSTGRWITCGRYSGGDSERTRDPTKVTCIACRKRLGMASTALYRINTDEELRRWWRRHGGDFHGPNVETGTMPEDKLLPLLRRLLS